MSQPLARRLMTALRDPWPDEPVRVTLVITDLDLGGAERVLVSLATGLNLERWAPAVVALGGAGELVTPLESAGIPVTCLDVNRRRPALAVRRLAHVLRSHRPALIQSFLFHANVASRLAASLAGRPWVLGGVRVAEREKRWHHTLERLTMCLGTGAVCVSEGVQRFMIEVAGIDPQRLTVIHNGIDPTRFDLASPTDRATIGIDDSIFMTLYIGRIEPQKAVPVLLRAASKAARLSPAWHLVIVGDGPDRARLQAETASSALLSERVHWLGRRTDVPSLLKSADLLVLPSLWEGMPNVVLEAMAATCPVVGTAVEGTEELIIPGETGWLVPPGDTEMLSIAMIEAWKDPVQTRRFGQAGRQLLDRGFTLNAMITAYESLWSRVLGHADRNSG